MLQTLIQTFPDNKIVEDVHNALRLEARGNQNDKLTPSTMQSVRMNSGILESRGISHKAEVTESEFIRSLGESGGVKEIYLAKARTLPEENIKLCGALSASGDSGAWLQDHLAHGSASADASDISNKAIAEL